MNRPQLNTRIRTHHEKVRRVKGILLGEKGVRHCVSTATSVKRHCLIFKESRVNPEGVSEDCVFVEDLSTNGTYVNGKRLVNGKREQLSHGDEIQLAKYDSRKAMEKFDDRFWIIQLPQAQTTGSSTGESIHDHFKFEKELGTGNFASVRVGVNKATGIWHAIKILDKKRFHGKPKIVESIRREVSLLMAVNHPCIINIGGVYDELDFIYIVLELARGGELFDLIIDKKKFSERECRVIMKQLFTALKYLHDRNIVHRDLKPENILLITREEGDLRIKISDFGLAKLVGEESFLKTLCGTPNYVAPEVLNPAKGRAYGKAVDLWSSGVILYICLCGFPPFSDELAPRLCRSRSNVVSITSRRRSGTQFRLKPLICVRS
ncbi:kinase-like domain-containing protein [Chytridium lagenaria]|nr:kinase-like domain-containing protein [Chytridium lagenaria]